MLDFTYQAHHYVDQGLDGDPDYFDLNLIAKPFWWCWG